MYKVLSSLLRLVTVDRYVFKGQPLQIAKRCRQATMDRVDLERRENELCLIVIGVHGTMEHKSEQLKDKGVFDAYRQIHSAYADKAGKDIESLKRGLFIQWYAMTEPSCFTGIDQLDYEAEKKIIQQLDKLIISDKLDNELKWMLKYYSAWDCVFERFKEYKGLQDWIHNDTGTDLPDTIDRNDMTRRGQMGKYWNSLTRFAK